MPNIEKFGLGRVQVDDARDKDFPMRSVLPKGTSERTYKYWWPSGWWGNQGRTPQCVAYSFIHFVEDGPITHFYDDNRKASQKPLFEPADIYRQAQLIDRFPGENYNGTTVRAGAKVLQQRGVIAEYRWAWDIDTVVQTLLEVGPVVVGTWWYTSMFYPDAKGYIKVGGSRAGGHAYLLNGVNTEKNIIRLKNSWGRDSWGKNGYAYISIDDMARLISEDGEACLALEKQLDQ